MKYFLLSIITLLIVSCGNEDFKRVYRLDEFRVLGIVVNNPEVAQGATVTLKPIISDREGGGRVITASVTACTDPGVNLGSEVKCDHDSSSTTQTYTLNTGTDVNLGAANLYTGMANTSVSVTVPANLLNGKNALEIFNGVNYLVIFNFEVDGKTTKVFKRISVTNRASLNTNPTVSQIAFNGSNASGIPSENTNLTCNGSGTETYQKYNIDGSLETKVENLTVAWYVTHGKLNSSKVDVSVPVKFDRDGQNIPSFAVLCIVRDERGGIALTRHVVP